MHCNTQMFWEPAISKKNKATNIPVEILPTQSYTKSEANTSFSGWSRESYALVETAMA